MQRWHGRFVKWGMLVWACWLAVPVAMAATHDGPLQVRRVSPSGQNVPTAQEVVIQFDRAMVALGQMRRDSASLPVHIAPDPGCQWRWLDTTALACRLPGQHQFAPATHYTITVGTGLKALDGSHLAKPLVRHFTTVLPNVNWSQFKKWLSPTLPTYNVYLNLPATAEQVAEHVGFVDSKGRWMASKVTPYTDKREGPLLIPLPGKPGAVLLVENPKPDTPLDARNDEAAGRRVWTVQPSDKLAAATDYILRVRPGLHTPLGPLSGVQKKNLEEVNTYGPFAFRGVACRDDSGDEVRADRHAHNPRRCMLGGARLLFSSDVPRETLMSLGWQPQPASTEAMAKAWQDSADWRLRGYHSGNAREDAPSYQLPFALAPMTNYVVIVPAGAKDHFGRVLAKPETVHFRTGHYRPFFNLVDDRVLEAGQDTVLPLAFTNLRSLSQRWQKRDAAGLASMRKAASARKQNLFKRADLDVATDHIAQGGLGVRELLGGASGVIWGKLHWTERGKGKKRDNWSFLAQVTPYEVVAKASFGNTLVWVSRWDNGRPVVGATVRLVHGNRVDLTKLTSVGKAATTNRHGLAVLSGLGSLPASSHAHWRPWRDYFVVVTQGKNAAVLPLQMRYLHRAGELPNYSIYGVMTARENRFRLWAVTEQGIYKPGSTVKFALFVRRQGQAGLEPVATREYTLRVVDPKGKKLAQFKHVTLSAYGGWHGQVELPAKAAMGRYAIMLKWKDGDTDQDRVAGHFRVADFVPAPFKVSTKVKGLHLAPGSKLPIEVDATLHAGGPYGDAGVKFTTRLRPEPFAPDTPATAGYAFGDHNPYQPDSFDIDEQQGRLDYAGHAMATVSMPDKISVPHGEVVVAGSVQSARGKWIADTVRLPYDATDRYIGLRTPDWMQTAGKPFTVDWLVVDAQGHVQPGSRLALTLQRHVAAQSDSADAYQPEWATQTQCHAVSGKAPGQCAFTPAEAGSYRVLASVTDTQGHVQETVLHTWVTGAGAVVWPSSDGVTLVPDQSSYEVGDTAHVLVQNPYPGAHALVTVERLGVLWKERVTLQGSAPIIEVPIKANTFPGAFLSVTIFKPRTAKLADPDTGKPALAMGYLRLQVTGKGPALKVQVTPTRRQYRPRQSVDVDVAVRTQAGKSPGKTQLVVAVVDQGVLDLLPQGTAYYDPTKVFYAPPEGLDTMNYSLEGMLSSVFQTERKPNTLTMDDASPKVIKLVNAPPKVVAFIQPPMEPPAPVMEQSLGAMAMRASDRARMPAIRSLFRNATYWNAALETDTQGHAHFQFKLPDNLTRWRILVIAVRPDAAMGLGDGSVRVNLPLQIVPALPNQVHVGDDFGAAFQITNRSDGSLFASARIQAQGALAGGKAQARKMLGLASMDHALAWLELKASRPGDITFTASAQAGTFGDAVKAHIPVTRAGTEVVAAQYGSLVDASASVPVKLPAKAMAGTARLSVRFAPTLVGGLDGAFARMRDDPLHTWEVRLSRGVLASDYLRLQPVLGDAMHWPDADKVIASTLQSASRYQSPDGGMAFWIAEDRYVSAYLSVYTALAFDWLHEAGHKPPAGVRKKLWGYLHKHVLTDKQDPLLRAGALAALALAPEGKLPKGAVADMLSELPQMRLFGQGLLLQAAVASRDRASADAIVRALLKHAEESAGGLSFNERQAGIYVDFLATPLRSNCVILDALSRYHTAWGRENLVGDVPQKLVRWISSRRRNQGGWPNSQENVFCTSGIVHFADAYETPVKALAGSAAWSGQAPLTAHFASRATPATELAGRSRKLARAFRSSSRIKARVACITAWPCTT